MAGEIRGVVHGNNSGTAPISFTTPADIKKGDWVLASFTDTIGDAAAKITPPDASWVTLSARLKMGTRYFTVFAHLWTGTESATLTFTQSATSSCTGSMLYGPNGVDPSTWQKGAAAARSASVATTTVAGITTTAASVIIGIVGEATSATTNEPAGISVAAPFTMYDWFATGGLNSVLFGYRVQTAAGATGDMVATFPNAAANSAGIMVAIPVAVPVVTHLDGRIFDGTDVVAGSWQLYDGTRLVELESVQLVRMGRKVSELYADDHVPVIAHRGGSRDYAEHSLRGYTQCALAGVDALEFSIARTFDGVWFGLHDATLNRTSPAAPANFNPAEHTWAEVQAYQCSVGDLAGFGPQPYMTLDQLVAAYGASHTLVLDPKVIGSANLPAFYAKVKTIPDYQERVILKYFHTGTGVADAARAMGVKSWGYSYTSDVTGGGTASTAAKWDYLGLEYSATQDVWNTILAIAGTKPVWGHICPTATDAATAITKGARGLMVSGVESVMAERYYLNGKVVGGFGTSAFGSGPFGQ